MMTDATTIYHDVDLLGDWLDAKGYTEEAGLCLRVLGLIREQQDEIENLRRALETRKAQVIERNAVIIKIYEICYHYYGLDKLETVNALHGETLEKLDDNT